MTLSASYVNCNIIAIKNQTEGCANFLQKTFKDLDCNYFLVTFVVEMVFIMSTKEKLRERFLKMPSDFTFDEMQQLLAGYGYIKVNKGQTSGSRVLFKNGNRRPIMLHKPHPGNIVKGYAMKQVYDDLYNAGLIKEKED